MRTWAPPGFRDWPEYEDKAARLSEWSPGIVTGMLQTEGYARGLLETATGATADIVAARLASPMERQKRVLFRDEDPPQAVYLVDHAALYRKSRPCPTSRFRSSRLSLTPPRRAVS